MRTDTDHAVAPLLVEIAIESEGWSQLPDAAALAEAAVGAAARGCRRELFEGAAVSLLLADDATLRALNARWRGQDKPTNVLSFPAAAPGALAAAPFLGDIAIAWETAAAEAVQDGKTIRDHVLHLAVHGFLHLVGYDHVTDIDADDMEDLEREILAELGVADPYREADLVTGTPAKV